MRLQLLWETLIFLYLFRLFHLHLQLQGTILCTLEICCASFSHNPCMHIYYLSWRSRHLKWVKYKNVLTETKIDGIRIFELIMHAFIAHMRTPRGKPLILSFFALYQTLWNVRVFIGLCGTLTDFPEFRDFSRLFLIFLLPEAPSLSPAPDPAQKKSQKVLKMSLKSAKSARVLRSPEKYLEAMRDRPRGEWGQLQRTPRSRSGHREPRRSPWLRELSYTVSFYSRTPQMHDLPLLWSLINSAKVSRSATYPLTLSPISIIAPAPVTLNRLHTEPSNWNLYQKRSLIDNTSSGIRHQPPSLRP